MEDFNLNLETKRYGANCAVWRRRLPLALVVHAVEAVPLGVELREGVPDLRHLGGGGIPDGVGLALVDGCDLLADMLQILLDALQTGHARGSERRPQ